MDGKALLKQLAPTAASFLFGPLAGVLVEKAGAALGMEDATIEQVRDTIRKGDFTGEQVTNLKKLELEAQTREKELNIKADEVANADTQGARQMQIAQPSNVPAALTFVVTFGFFAVLGAMFRFPEIKESAPLMIMLGALGSEFAACCKFWLGSTNSSQQTRNLLAQSSPVK